MSGYEVNTNDITQLSSRLQTSGKALDEGAINVPDPPLAGTSTGVVMQALEALARSAGSLTLGMGAAADAVNGNMRTYGHAEVQSIDTVDGMGRE